jgi:hypothetical protein
LAERIVAASGLKIGAADTDSGRVSSFGVYVIQLRTCPDRTALGALYVGSSWYVPSERLRQHNEGDKTGAVGLRGQCRRLRPELYLDLPWHWDRQAVFRLEHQRACRLAEAGFHVRCDGRTHSAEKRQRKFFTGDELALVGEEFDRCAREILAAAAKKLSLEELVRVLRWTASDATVVDLISVPNDELGRFAHVGEESVRARIYRRLGHHLRITT